jgi:hypothetical protein
MTSARVAPPARGSRSIDRIAGTLMTAARRHVIVSAVPAPSHMERCHMQMGTYCKAYPIDRFRAYPQWRERTQHVRADKSVDGTDTMIARPLGDEAVLYLHEDYRVTDGIFIDAHVIVDDVSEHWIDYCGTVLEFDAAAGDVGVAAVAVDHATTATPAQ